eukprot:3270284-Heterocapsa_arctica.AAC.1
MQRALLRARAVVDSLSTPPTSSSSSSSRASSVGEPGGEPEAEPGADQEVSPPAGAPEVVWPRAEAGHWARLALPDPAPPDVRVYAVWSLPHPREGVGIYVGVHPATWELLVFQSGGQNPLSSGARLRRYSTLERARTAWLRDAPLQLRRSLTWPPPLWIIYA